HFLLAPRYRQAHARRPFLRNTHAPYGAPGLMPWKYSLAKPRTHAPVCFGSNIPGFSRRKTGAFARSYERGQPITSRRALHSPFDSRCLLLVRGSAQMGFAAGPASRTGLRLRCLSFESTSLVSVSLSRPVLGGLLRACTSGG